MAKERSPIHSTPLAPTSAPPSGDGELLPIVGGAFCSLSVQSQAPSEWCLAERLQSPNNPKRVTVQCSAPWHGALNGLGTLPRSLRSPVNVP